MPTLSTYFISILSYELRTQEIYYPNCAHKGVKEPSFGSKYKGVLLQSLFRMERLLQGSLSPSDTPIIAIGEYLGTGSYVDIGTGDEFSVPVGRK